MGVKGTRAEQFAKRMQELHQQLDREKVWRKNARREHRLAWRRAYYRKKRDGVE